MMHVWGKSHGGIKTDALELHVKNMRNINRVKTCELHETSGKREANAQTQASWFLKFPKVETLSLNYKSIQQTELSENICCRLIQYKQSANKWHPKSKIASK